MKKIIVLDFDATVHAYTTGWHGFEVVADPPVEGAFAFIKQLLDAVNDRGHVKYQVVILSSRCKAEHPEGILAMKTWFDKWGLEPHYLARIDFATEKPPAHLLIDDRGFQFTGSFPSLEYIDNFKPWNKI